MSELLAEERSWSVRDSLRFVHRLAGQVQALHQQGRTHRAISADTVGVDERLTPRLDPAAGPRRFGGDDADPEFCPPVLGQGGGLELLEGTEVAAAILQKMGHTYVEGESLAEWLADQGQLGVDRTLHVLEDCLAGLGAVHAHGLIHRGIKPGNIVIETRTRRAMLVDFGLTRGGDAGTPAASSELVLTTVDYLPPGVIELVERMMAKSPASRYQTCEEVLADVRKVRRGKPDRGDSSPAPPGEIQFAETLPPAGVDAQAESLAKPVGSPLARLRSWIAARLGRDLPEPVRMLRSTTQELDGALASRQRRRNQLAKARREAKSIIADLARQIQANLAAAREAENQAEAAPNEEGRTAARSKQRACEEEVARLRIQRSQQQRWEEDLELQLAKADAALAFSPDGTTLALMTKAQTEVNVRHRIKTVTLWDVATGKRRQSLEISPEQRDRELETVPPGLARPGRYRGDTYSLAFSPDGSLLASSAECYSARVWDVKTGRVRQTFKGDRLLSGDEDARHRSPRGSSSAGGTGGSLVGYTPSGRDIKPGETRTRWIAPALNEHGDPKGARGLVVTFDGDVLESPALGAGHEDDVCAVAFSPDGSSVYSAGWDFEVRVWRCPERQPRPRPELSTTTPPASEASLPQGELGTNEVRRFMGHTARPWGVDCSPDNLLVASGGADRTVCGASSRAVRSTALKATRVRCGRLPSLPTVGSSPLAAPTRRCGFGGSPGHQGS